MCAASVSACASAAASFIIYESISSVGSSRLVSRYELSSFSVIIVGFCTAKIRIYSYMAKEMRVFLFFLVKRVGERGLGMAFLTGLKWGTFYCNVVIVMV